MAEESAIVKTVYDGSVSVKPGAGGSYAIPASVSMDISALVQAQKEVIVVEARGELVSLRKGKRKYPSGSIEIYLSGLSDATKTTILDYFLKTGSQAAGTSTTAAIGDVWTIDIILTIKGSVFGDASDHVFTLEDCHVEVGVKEGEPDTITGSFTCYGTVNRS